MSQYWVIAPFDATSPETYEMVWQFDVTNGVISIGWSGLGDITSFESKDALKSEYEKQSDIENPGTITRIVNMLWSFYHEIDKGDVVIARRGTKRLAAVGVVKGKAYYDQTKGESLALEYPEYDHCSFIDVEWQGAPRDKEYNRVVFGIQTLYEIGETEYKALVDDSDTAEIEEMEEGIENRSQFFLEKYLEQFIVDNFASIFGGKINLLEDGEGNLIGRQYRTDVGTIDILGFEKSTNSFVVIELKKGRASDKVVGQILRYIGWVSEELCRDEQKVKGIIICREPDDKLYYALIATPNIELKYYHIDFKLFDTPSD